MGHWREMRDVAAKLRYVAKEDDPVESLWDGPVNTEFNWAGGVNKIRRDKKINWPQMDAD